MTFDHPTPARPNPYLRAMLLVGILLFLTGVVWAILGITMINPAQPLSSDLVKAQLGIAIGTSLGGFGLFLLLVAWIIAAAKHR